MDTQARISQLEQYLSSDPGNLNLICDLVDLYLQVGPADELATHLQQAAALAPEHPRVRYQHASWAMAQSNFAEAASILSLLLSEGIDSLGVRYNLALSQSLLGDYSLALTTLTPCITEEGEHYYPAELLYLRLLHHNGDLQTARELIPSLLAQYPEQGDLHGMASILYLDSNQQDLARQHAERALELGSTSLESYCSLGTLNLEEMDVDAAKMHFQAALDKQPQDGRSWLGKGLAAMLELDLELGETCLEQAVNYMPRHAGSWNCLCWLRIMKQDIAGAEKAANTAMDLDRNFSENHGTLAVIKVIQGNRQEAEGLVERALRLDRMSFSGNFAQTLLMDPDADKEKINKRIQRMMSVPIVEGGMSIGEGLKRYGTKFGDKERFK